MAEFNWQGTPKEGSCVLCGTAENDGGFVDCIGSTIVTSRDGLDPFDAIVDIVICANCLRQAARLVGCASPQEVDDLVRKSVDDDEKIEGLEREIEAWQERFIKLSDLKAEDFDRLSKRVGLVTPDRAADSSPPPLPPEPVSGSKP